MQPKKWLSPRPKQCQVCGHFFKDGETFIDGTILGHWVLMCKSCHQTYGVGLGVGKGQEYDWSSCLKVGG